MTHTPPFIAISPDVHTDLRDLVWQRETSARGHRAIERGQWHTSGSFAAAGEMATEVLYESHETTEQCLIATWGEDCVIRLTLGQRSHEIPRVAISVSGDDPDTVRAVLDELREVFPRSCGVDDSDNISVRFWVERYDSSDATVRQVAAPRWSEIAANYPASTRRELAPAMENLDALVAGGRVLLWHGPAGTGKTFALRAFAREHSQIATLDYILEPQVIFGSKAASLLDVLTDEGQGGDDDRWRILVLEDCDELISADAKERSGQGLAQLLNLTDGLFGQALKALVVLTTNEPVGALHPALSRPGRCGSLVSFHPFNETDARDWLAASECPEATVHGPATLAELYAIRAGRNPRSARGIGFAGSTG